jgi:hypothetical protein
VEANQPEKVSPFEFTYLGDVAASEVNYPSGNYKGYICLKQEGRPHIRIAEQELEIIFSEGISARTSNSLTHTHTSLMFSLFDISNFISSFKKTTR